MTTDENGPEVRLTPRDQESLAVGGGLTPIVAQLQRRREAASRCEPLDCGHQDPLDCTAAGCADQASSANTEEGYSPASTPDPEPPLIEAGDFVQLWAKARSLFFAKDFPPYASPAWRALHPDDPRRLAAALNAAEMWRLYGDEEALLQWFRDVSQNAKDARASSKSYAELQEARRPRPPHQLRATPGWPPIRVPGGRGRYLTYKQHQEAA